MMEAEVGPGRCTSRKGCGVAGGGGSRSVKRNMKNERKGLTVSICTSLPKGLIEGVTALIIKEIGVHSQLFRRVPSTGIFAEQL